VCHVGAAVVLGLGREEHVLLVNDGSFVSDDIGVGAAAGTVDVPAHTPFSLESDFDTTDIHMLRIVENDGASNLDRLGFVAFAMEDSKWGVKPDCRRLAHCSMLLIL
jgi:hypothetical protein